MTGNDMEVNLNIQGLDAVINTLKQLPPEVVSKRGGVVKQAVAAGARVIRNEARKNLVKVTSTAGKTGVSYGSGLTAKNVITKRKNLKNGENGEKYIVSVAYKVYPIGKSLYKKRPIKFNDIAFMLEYGTSKQAAEPWLRPAFDVKKQEAMDKMQSELIKKVDKISSDLLKKTQNAT